MSDKGCGCSRSSNNGTPDGVIIVDVPENRQGLELVLPGEILPLAGSKQYRVVPCALLRLPNARYAFLTTTELDPKLTDSALSQPNLFRDHELPTDFALIMSTDADVAAIVEANKWPVGDVRIKDVNVDLKMRITYEGGDVEESGVYPGELYLNDEIETQFPSYYRDIVSIAPVIWVPWCHPAHYTCQPGNVRMTECDGTCFNWVGYFCECSPGNATCVGHKSCTCI